MVARQTRSQTNNKPQEAKPQPQQEAKPKQEAKAKPQQQAQKAKRSWNMPENVQGRLATGAAGYVNERQRRLRDFRDDTAATARETYGYLRNKCKSSNATPEEIGPDPLAPFPVDMLPDGVTPKFYRDKLHGYVQGTERGKRLVQIAEKGLSVLRYAACLFIVGWVLLAMLPTLATDLDFVEPVGQVFGVYNTSRATVTSDMNTAAAAISMKRGNMTIGGGMQLVQAAFYGDAPIDMLSLLRTIFTPSDEVFAPGGDVPGLIRRAGGFMCLCVGAWHTVKAFVEVFDVVSETYRTKCHSFGRWPGDFLQLTPPGAHEALAVFFKHKLHKYFKVFAISVFVTGALYVHSLFSAQPFLPNQPFEKLFFSAARSMTTGLEEAIKLVQRSEIDDLRRVHDMLYTDPDKSPVDYDVTSEASQGYPAFIGLAALASFFIANEAGSAAVSAQVRDVIVPSAGQSR